MMSSFQSRNSTKSTARQTRPIKLVALIAVVSAAALGAQLWVRMNREGNMATTEAGRRRRGSNQWTSQGSTFPSRRIVLATIPRSGNGWIRGMLEGSTGVATASVYPEKAAFFSSEIDAYSTNCGWLADCTLVQRPSSLPVVIKTHFPFLGSVLGDVKRPNTTETMSAAVADVNGTVEYVISSVRNPLGNFEAWQRYTTKRGNLPHDPHQTVRSFLDAWAAHHEYWASVGLPLTVYRYEDLIEDPVGVLVKTLRASGLWDHCGVRDIDLLYVANISSLHSYRRKQAGSSMSKKDDIWHAFTTFNVSDIEYSLTKHGKLLKRFGYDDLYRAWLKAKKENKTVVKPTYVRPDGAGASLPPISLYDSWESV